MLRARRIERRHGFDSGLRENEGQAIMNYGTAFFPVYRS